MTTVVAGPTPLTPLARLFAKGAMARAILAWLVAAAVAGLSGATLTVAFLVARESVLNPPFPPSAWWVFINLWRPLLIAGAVLVAMFSGPLAALSVWLIRRNRWPRPAADMVAGVLCALGMLIALLLIARQFGPMGDGP